MAGQGRGGETTQEKRSLGNASVGELFIPFEGHTELRLPGLLGVLGCVLKGGKGVLILESSLQIHAPKL